MIWNLSTLGIGSLTSSGVAFTITTTTGAPPPVKPDADVTGEVERTTKPGGQVLALDRPLPSSSSSIIIIPEFGDGVPCAVGDGVPRVGDASMMTSANGAAGREVEMT